ncbi:hypothetical protein GR183_06505 [Stappia sp. GBMRC 2046]|uniref:Uncharacterized protein n=1 Tax=Stappia sediminis TaxID=2692190 RepID=A0A7X3LSZ0_9HYPH|nr:hypothetical protein [Stappia sediminis]MXN64550.1 hypothetical protein [Stappia sediminis]
MRCTVGKHPRCVCDFVCACGFIYPDGQDKRQGGGLIAQNSGFGRHQIPKQTFLHSDNIVIA